MEVDTYALNSLGCIGAAYGCSVMSSGWRKHLVCLATLMSCDTMKLSVCLGVAHFGEGINSRQSHNANLF